MMLFLLNMIVIPNYILDDLLPNIVSHTNSQGLQMPSNMDLVRDDITNSFVGIIKRNVQFT